MQTILTDTHTHTHTHPQTDTQTDTDKPLAKGEILQICLKIPSADFPTNVHSA